MTSFSKQTKPEPDSRFVAGQDVDENNGARGPRGVSRWAHVHVIPGSLSGKMAFVPKMVEYFSQ